MRTITIELYQFDELSDDAKERARAWWLSTGDYWDSSDWWNSAQAFAAIAPVRIDSADYDRAQVDCKWTGDDVRELSGLRAWKWLQNNGWFDWAAKNKAGDCTMTGFCGDCGFGAAIHEYARKPLSVPDLEQVFYEAAQAWVKEAQSDYEGASEDEYVDDMLRANEYEFDIDGNHA